MIAKKFVVFCCFVTYALGYKNQFGSQYGKEWVLYSDENNVTHRVDIASLSMAQDSRVGEVQDVYFHLYTRDNRKGEELTLPINNTLASKYYKANNALKIITHGWMSSADTDWVAQMVEAYLYKGDYNVITIDWSEIASNPLYPIAAAGTRQVGQQTAKMLDAIAKTYNQNGRNMHLVGHSLGAHVMGFAGSYTLLNISRISGLDPAKPCFEYPLVGPEARLDEGDADFVDIIHTCGGVLGYHNSRGDADFYPNSGQPPQPGCAGLQEIIESCSHGRSELLFIESIYNKTPFYAYPCESWDKFKNGECNDDPVIMGEPTSMDNRGNFYLYTNSKPNFSKGLNATMSAEAAGNVTKPMD